MGPADWRELPSPTDEIHGDGDDPFGEEIHGDGDALFGDDFCGGGDHSQSPAKTSELFPQSGLLSEEQVAFMQQHHARWESLQEAKRVLGTVEGPGGAALVANVQKVIDHEVRAWRERLGGDAKVDKAMRDLADAEERQAVRRRLEFQETVQQVVAKRRVEQELKEAKAKLQKV